MKPIAQRLARGVLATVTLVVASLTGAAYDIAVVSYPGSLKTSLTGTNGIGQIAGSATFSEHDTEHGFIYDVASGAFTNLPGLAGYTPAALGINDAGVVVGNAFQHGGAYGAGSDFGFVLRDRHYALFYYPPFTHTWARAIGNAGLVTGNAYSDDSYAFAAFVYDPARESFTSIDIPGALYITPQGITGANRVVGSVYMSEGDVCPGSPYGSCGFVRDPDGTITLFSINSQPTFARGVNDSGQITGYIATGAEGESATFVVTVPRVGSYQVLRVPTNKLINVRGAKATKGQAIDINGRVVGGWESTTGESHGFIATPTGP